MSALSSRKNVANDVETIRKSLESNDLLSTKELILALKSRNDKKQDLYWLTKSNFFMGYVYRLEGDFEKSIIHYLEAIRYSKKADYEDARKDLISLQNRCAAIFEEFKATDLAFNYYNEGIRYALDIEDTTQLINLNYNVAELYRNEARYDSALTLFNHILHHYFSQPSDKNRMYFNTINRLSFTHYSKGEIQEAIAYAEELITKQDKYPQITVYALHNMGIYKASQLLFDESENYFKQAINQIQQIKNADPTHTFKLYLDLGDTYIKSEKKDQALQIYLKAKELIPDITQHPEFFKAYKILADLYYDKKAYSLSREYENLYANSLNEYIETQQKIQEMEIRFNMDLITSNYFADLEKQQEISSIIFYSKLISGCLLALLLSFFAYYRYDKLKIRRSIESALMSLKLGN